jgi:hypothetical protein
MFPSTVHGYAVGMAAVNKTEFTNKFDLGVPLDLPTQGTQDILLLYSRAAAMPKKHRRALLQTGIQHISAEEAVENCDYLNLIYTYELGKRDQCVAIIPQYESHHIMKWMRMPPSNEKGGLNKNLELRPVGRGMLSNGVDSFIPPHFQKHTKRHWGALKTYLDSVDDVLNDLRPIVNRIKVENTVIVMVCNHGQSELLLNFACSAHSRGLDISNIIVFGTDQETKELAESVGLAAYYDERVSWGGELVDWRTTIKDTWYDAD